MEPQQPIQPQQPQQPETPQPLVQPAIPTQPITPTPQPMATPTPPMMSANSGGGKSKKGLVIVMVVVGVLVLVGIGAGAYFLLTGSSSPASSITNAVKGSSDVQDRSDGTLDVSNLIEDKQTSLKNQDIKAKLNQQVNLSDGTSFMITKVERNYVSDSKYVKAAAGKELVKVSVVVGNRLKSGTVYATSGMFKATNAAGGSITAEFLSKDDVADAIVGTSIDPGKQLAGVVIYEVDSGEAIQAISVTNKYKNYTTEETIEVKGTVSLQ
ncbi:MAG: hypothetical protein QG553_537 [Patescibacteria group bacterium]|nr:hypothetical protein [Patescibacteria group bacterium]